MSFDSCCGGVQMFKNMRLVLLFAMFLNASCKMMTSFGDYFDITAISICNQVINKPTHIITVS